MALFNKLFSAHKRKNVSSTTSHQTTSQFPFSNEQVRVLLYRECDWRGRRLLFDSTALEKVNLSIVPPNPTSKTHTNQQTNGVRHHKHGDTTKQTSSSSSSSTLIEQDNKKFISYIDTINGYGYKYSRPSAETELHSIGEMVFGAAAMSMRATTLKVHWLQAPTRILCSQVFLSPQQSNNFSSTGNTILDTTTAANGNGNTTANDLNSMDTSSLNSFSLSVSVCIADNLNSLGVDKFHTNPLDVPSSTESSDGGRSLAYSDSGYSGTDPWSASCSSYCPYNSSARSSFGSVYSDREASRKYSTDSSILTTDLATTNVRSDSNLQRRILRNMTTSFENRKSVSDSVGFIGALSSNISNSTQQQQRQSIISQHQQHQQQLQQQQQQQQPVTGTAGGSEGYLNRARRCSEQVESRSNPEMFRKRTLDPLRSLHSSYGPTVRTTSKRSKLGLAICITLSDSVEDDMQIFCTEHIMLLESMLCRLRATAENACINQKKFLQIMLHAWLSTTQWISDLFTAPRLRQPVWMTLSTGSAVQPTSVANSFMNELCWLINCADTKDTNFFISTLLTAILTHHLGWVGTVAPLSVTSMRGTPNITAQTATARFIANQEKAKMSEISKFHPYNVLWAQMSDLYGAIGNPPKMSKTIVCGNETNTVNKLLNVLTYFIRCGQIERDQKSEIYEKKTIDNILNDFIKCKENPTTAASNNMAGATCSSGTINKITRNSTCLKDLTKLNLKNEKYFINDDDLVINNNDTTTTDLWKIQEAVNDNITLDTATKKNDIPNVLIFRDSRFVRQELRIGNYLMDTGITMNTKQRRDIKNYQVKNGGQIKLMVTNPDNQEFPMNGDGVSNSSDDTVEEATELLEIRKTSLSLSNLITANSVGSTCQLNNNQNNSMMVDSGGKTASLPRSVTTTKTFLWGIEPIKEGISDEQWQHIEKGESLKKTPNNSNGNCFSDSNIEEQRSMCTDGSISNAPEFKRSKSLYTKSTNSKNVEHIKKSKISRKKSFTDFETQTHRTEQQQCNIENEDPQMNNNLKSYQSLSDLITANSVGVSERLMWGTEPVKESVTLDEEMHFEFAKRMIAENDRRETTNGVVFVLGGDNESLINLKNSIKYETRDISSSSSPSSSPLSSLSLPIGGDSGIVGGGINNSLKAPPPSSPPPPPPPSNSKFTSSTAGSITPTATTSTQSTTTTTKKICSHKKHSGVKFNFEKYPQIATNYMKNKNIDLSNYDFFDKSLKLDEQNPAQLYGTTNTFPLKTNSMSDEEDTSDCECCAGHISSILLQTPSNATELEFSSDDNTYPTSTTTTTAETSTATTGLPLKSIGNVIINNPSTSSSPTVTSQTPQTQQTISRKTKKLHDDNSAAAFINSNNKLQRSSVASLLLGDDNHQDLGQNTIQLITLPISKSAGKFDNATTKQNKEKHRPGFVPSLFVGISDHYIADMILQGTNTPLNKWETSLRQNLSLSSHCAILEQTPTENVAIVANINEWDVKVISSQTYVLPCGSGTSGPIGMSQLVASMLETVHAMWTAGIPAYQCMSFMESKLQEMYLQSETLAAFLLATEFCSLSTVTSALNLSANDVPLLLSVASIHSPQVTKKYGVSFR